ncbi:MULTISPECIES: hypothetical protein [unclassified Acinetobacter]|uniref:hypothetical protein n=1 Tax=unclassified Acinetobacter TaxID=196816 RepID=UPI0015D387CF|nr:MULTISPECIES: hypothetical protein [unclassified Acinetobacter]
MPILYYGIHPLVAIIVALVWASLSVYIFFRLVNSKRATKNHAFGLIGSVFVVALLLYISNDLRKPITDQQATQLDSYLSTSIEYGSLGYEFRDAMDKLAESNGVVTTSELSLIGDQIYTTYLTKHNWNQLAKIYNESNLPKDFPN